MIVKVIIVAHWLCTLFCRHFS